MNGMTLRVWQGVSALSLVAIGVVSSGRAEELSSPAGNAWARHTISDRAWDGPDGTKLADIDGDGQLDIVSGFEGEGITVLFRNPGRERVREAWPSVKVGKTPKAEDATFIDVDRDGRLDIVAATEQHFEKVFVHWHPGDAQQIWEADAWQQTEIAAVTGKGMWMYTAPLPSRAKGLEAIVLGGKNYLSNQTADLGLVLLPAEGRAAAAFEYQPLAKVSWVMSIELADLNEDGHVDIIYSDKHGPACGVWWLENPSDQVAGKASQQAWARHPLLTADYQGAMFLSIADLDRDGVEEVIVPIDWKRTNDKEAADHQHRRIAINRKLDRSGLRWKTTWIQVPPHTGQPKGIAAGDINGDGDVELVVTSSGADGDAIGAYWLEYRQSPEDEQWQAHNIAGPEGSKFDLVHLIDLDGDGDLDALTSEENEGGKGLGVVWYENQLQAVVPRVGSTQVPTTEDNQR